MHETLLELGHDVLSATEVDPSATDGALLALAMEQERVIITEDKDFGELVFLHGLRHPCIVRFVDMQVSEKVSAMRELIDQSCRFNAWWRDDRGHSKSDSDTFR